MNSSIVVAAIFAAMLGLVWLVLYFGSRWFSARQNETAAQNKADLEGMFIFTDANRIMAINLRC